MAQAASSVDDVSSAKTHQPPRGIRWWPAAAIVAVIGGAVVAAQYTPEHLIDAANNVLSMSLVLFGALLLFLWMLLFSRMRWKTRLSITGVLALLGVAVALTVRIDGFHGDVLPRLVWAWSPRLDQMKPGEIYETHSDATAPSDIDLSKTTPGDYPRFLGPRGLAVAPMVATNSKGQAVGKVRLKPWNEHPPKLLWRRNIGLGWSAFVVVGDWVITMEQRGEMECTVCYHLQTGKQMWVHKRPTRFNETMGGDGPRATPTIHEGKVYALGANGDLDCLDGATGKAIWSVNILKDAGTENLTWGMAGSPLIVDDMVIVNPGGREGKSLAAYDKATGKIIWHAGDDQAGYGSPTLTTIHGTRQILILTGQQISSHDPKTGRILWTHPWKTTANLINTTQPLSLNDYNVADRQLKDTVFVASGYGYGSGLIRVMRKSDGSFVTEQLWFTRHFRTKFSHYIVFDDAKEHVIAIGDRERSLGILALKSGEMIGPRRKRYDFGQVLLAGDKLIVQAEAGYVDLIKPDLQKHVELGSVEGLADKTWNNPALAHGKYLLIRNDREAKCYELAIEHIGR